MASLALFLVSAGAALASPCDNVPTVTIDSGSLYGTTTTIDDTIVNKFVGIPFAFPPERFSPPEPVPAWGEHHLYDAATYGPSCIQKFNGKDGPARDTAIEIFHSPPPPGGEDEDCLNLNVWTKPPENDDDLRPVMIWFYGGGYEFGSASLARYDGSVFAATHDVVIVAFNYRVNLFGFPGSPSLPKEHTNLGYLDQRLALDWIQRNIRSFGGDPDRVTLFGESAGAGSIDALLTAPPDPIPFHAAILQSGVASIRFPGDESSVGWEALLGVFDCPHSTAGKDIECLRAVPAVDLQRAAEEMSLSFIPRPDGVTYNPLARLARLNSTESSPGIARVPILIGSNSDEASLTAIAATESFSDTVSAMLSAASIPDEIIAVFIAVYTSSFDDDFSRLNAFGTEFLFQCQEAAVASDSSSAGIPTWRYLFEAAWPNTQVAPGAGAWHSAEIFDIFGTYEQETSTETQREMSVLMQKAWVAMATNPSKGPGWEQTPQLARWGEDFEVVHQREVDGRCALWRPLIDLVTGVTEELDLEPFLTFADES